MTETPKPLIDRRVIRIWEVIGIALMLQVAFIIPVVALREGFGLHDELPIWIANAIGGGLFPIVITALAGRRTAAR